MSLLIITNSYPDPEGKSYGGSFVKGQVDELRRYFNEIYVISPHPLGTSRFLRDYSYDNVHVYYPRFFHLPIGFFRKRLGDNFYRAALRIINRKGLEFDLIHAHFTWPSGYAGALLKEKFGVPLIVTAHGFDVYDLPFRGEVYLRKVLKALESADQIITVSRSNFLVLTERLGIPAEKISLIPNGFNGRKFRPMDKIECRRSLGLPLEKKIVLTVGNLVPVKGHEYLLEAVKMVLEREPNTFFVIVGDGPLRKKVEELAKKLGISENVYFAGSRPHEEIPLWMNAADLFVLPSLRESFGVVVLEALAVGTPVVATINGGSEEIITSENYGFLCPPKDPECLAEKVLIALEKEWDKGKIREYARQFMWNNIVKQIVKVYTSMV
ncbi:glycosyltransferase family 4 protein [Thermococcus sp. Bubb.Bath]|nr:glycosyltransferase family 4 protein [Thermococcus sp. Bubb.Bath]